jgi:endonuclease/exonuclease/phosphatase family metal-dependent hydrolase
MKSATTAPALETALLTGFLVCFFQVLADFIESTYAFGLLRIGIPVEVASLVFFFAPAGLLLARRVSVRRLAMVGGCLLLSRAVSLVGDTRIRMLAAAAGTGLFLVWMPMLLATVAAQRDRRIDRSFSVALTLAALILTAFFAAGSGNDITRQGLGRWLGLAWVVGTGVLLGRWLPSLSPPPPCTPMRVSWGAGLRAAGLAVGLMSPVLVLYFGFGIPSVVARWTGGDPVRLTVAATGVMGLFLATQVGVPRREGASATAVAVERAFLPWSVCFAWNLVLVAGMALGLWACQTAFPQATGAYPVEQLPLPWWGRVVMGGTLFLLPVVFVNFGRFAQAMIDGSFSLSELGLGFLGGGAWLLVGVLSQVFTSVYDYIPVVGPWFRDRFWVAGLVVGAGLVFPLWLVRGRPEGASLPEGGAPMPAWAFVGLGCALGASMLAAVGQAVPIESPARSTLRVMTFNVQQGYSAGGQRNFKGQLEFIRRAGPDVIGLQETDTARMAGGNADLVRYLGDQLNYHSYYGPRTVNGTFGVALLSRYPLVRARTFYLGARGEQTAVIAAEVRIGGAVWHVYVTHLGNGGPAGEQRDLLKCVDEKSRVILMGDFNSRPGEPAYELAVQLLADSWLGAEERSVDPPGQDLSARIDHVFVSRETRVLRADYWGEHESDHPVLMVVLGTEGSSE